MIFLNPNHQNKAKKKAKKNFIFLCETLYLIIGFINGLFITILIQNLTLYCYSRHQIGNVNNSLNINEKRLPKIIKSNIKTNIENESFLFIGLIASQNLLATRAKSTQITWAKKYKNMNSTVFYFTEWSTESDYNLPVVRLNGVDNSYPPQKKSFTMLKYMYENYLDKYEWFIRADDDVYIQLDKIELFLRSLNSSKPLLIGQPGFGNKEEIGKIFIKNDKMYCMGGPGVILSRETLRIVGPYLDFCFKNLVFTNHEDTEISRCINLVANLSCTMSYEMKFFFVHFNEKLDKSMYDHYISKYQSMITIHPFKDFRAKYAIHNAISRHRINKLKHKYYSLKVKNKNIEHKLNKSIKLLSSGYIGNYDFFDSSLISYSISNKYPKRRLEVYFKTEIENIQNRLMYELNRDYYSNLTELKLVKTLYGYINYNQFDGLNYIFNNLVSYENGKKKTPMKHYIHLRRPYVDFKFIEQENIDKSLNNYINFILPLSGRLEIFQNFMQNYEDVCLSKNERTRLVLVLNENSKSNEVGKKQSELIQDMINILKKKYSKTLDKRSIKLVVTKLEFSRSLNLQLGIDEHEDDDLLILIDVDIKFDSDLLTRIRLNAIQHKQVYYPIVFNQFNPAHFNKKYSEIDSDTGHWRDYGFGMMAGYKSDLNKVGGFNTSIVGWGKEDVVLFEKFLASNLTIFRSVDPSLIHVYHEKICDKNLEQDQLKMCYSSKSVMYASNGVLSNILFNKFKFNSTSTNN